MRFGQTTAKAVREIKQIMGGVIWYVLSFSYWLSANETMQQIISRISEASEFVAFRFERFQISLCSHCELEE
jgi:hypothetical protein